VSDENIQVSITAQIQDLLTGLGKAQESVKEATEGMTGSISGLAKTFEEMGGAAVLMAGVGLAMEGLSKGVEYVQEAVRETNELAESFQDLRYATMASVEQLNTYTMAIEMDGGKVGDLEHLMVGMQRGIKANSEALVANGVASSEAALKGLSFEEYLARVSKIADEMATPTDREQFLIQALGRSGATAGQQLKEFVEHLEKARGISEKGGIITDQSIERMEETKAATARLEIAQQKYAASVSSWANSIGNWWRNAHAAWLENETDLAEVNHLIQAGLINNIRYGQSLKDLVPEVAKIRDMWREIDASSSDVGVHNGPKPGTLHDKEAPKKEKPTVDPQIAYEMDVANDLQEIKANQEKEFAKIREAGLKEWNTQQTAQAKGALAVELNTAKDMEEEKKNAEKRALEIREKNLLEWNLKQQRMLALQENSYRDFLNGMTQGWGQSIQSMLHGQMSLSQGFKGALQQMESQTEMSLINMGLNWLKAAALQALIGKESHATQIMTDAKGAAAGAYNATVGIPYVGPFLAPAAAAVAFAGVMAFAEGGWDRVPSDQVAMIHKNEMVLPAHIAEPVRQMAAAGGGGGIQLHVQAMDAKSFHSYLSQHQGALAQVLQTIARNGRKS
jgi:hypothetical protein